MNNFDYHVLLGLPKEWTLSVPAEIAMHPLFPIKFLVSETEDIQDMSILVEIEFGNVTIQLVLLKQQLVKIVN